MFLSEINNATGIAVAQDGEFETLGFLVDTHDRELVFLEKPEFLRALQNNSFVSAVLTTAELASEVPGHLGLGVCAHPRATFAKLHNELALNGFYWDNFPTNIHPSARVHRACWIDESNVRIGANTEIGANATILQRCILGDDVVVGAGAILGGVGFQTVRSTQPMLEMNHAGGLLIKDRARILPGAVIATGLFRQPTLISEDARIGSRAFVSHAVQVGRRVFIGHGSVINGNVSIGDDSWVGPGAIVSQNLRLGGSTFVSLGAVVIRNLDAGARVSGNFAVPHRKLLRMLASLEQSDCE